MENSNKGWTSKGGSLSDKNARKEYGISQEEIIAGIKEKKLDYRVNYIHGNPYYKLLREEVELLLIENYGENHLAKVKIAARINKITSELRKLKRQTKSLTIEKDELESKLKDLETNENKK